MSSSRDSVRLALEAILVGSVGIINAPAEALFVEQFEYPDGPLQSASSDLWTPTASDDANPHLLVESEALSWDFTGEPADPPNNGYYAATFDDSGISSGALYAHFDLSVVKAPTSSSLVVGRIASFWNGSEGYRARLWIGTGFDENSNPISNTFRLGITEAAGSRVDVQWDERNFNEGESISVVLKYDYESGTVSLYLNATLESDPHLQVDDGSNLAAQGFAFRHKDESSPSSNLGAFIIDNLAISQAFGDTTPGESLGASNLVAEGIPGEAILLAWTDRSFDEAEFRVERRATSETTFELIATTEPNRSFYTDLTTITGTSYEYRVIANNGADLDASPIASATAFLEPEPFEAPAIEINIEKGNENAAFDAREGGIYRIEQSSNLSEWNLVEERVNEQAKRINIPITDPESSPTFIRVQSSKYTVPPDKIGLLSPFQSPENGGGATFDITATGATPNDDSDDDALAIQSALEQLNPGDLLLIPEGDFHIKTKITIPTGFILSGHGSAQSNLIAVGLETAIEIEEGTSDISLRDFSIDSDDDTLAYGVFIGEPNGTNAERILIENLDISNFSMRGIQIRNANHVKIDGCSIHHATNLGDGGFGYGIALNDSNNHDNWITNCEIGPVIRHGVLIQFSAHNNLVERNICFETTEDAYDLHGEEEYANELRFNLAYWGENASFEGSPAGFGIGNTGATHDASGPNNWIHNNEVYGYDIGIEVIQSSHVQYLDGNRLHDNANAGIKIHNGGGDGIHLRGNVITDNAIGISADRASALLAERNQVNRNNLGLFVSGNSFGYSIRNNDLQDNAVTKSLRNDIGLYLDNTE